MEMILLAPVTLLSRQILAKSIPLVRPIITQFRPKSKARVALKSSQRVKIVQPGRSASKTQTKSFIYFFGEFRDSSSELFSEGRL